MHNSVFNTTFENMLRILLLLDVIHKPIDLDRISALDFICIYGKNCQVLDKNLHGDNEFGFAEFAYKREKIKDAIKLSVRNDFVTVNNTSKGFQYNLNKRGKDIVKKLESPYARAYKIGAKIVYHRFARYSDEKILKYISDKAIQAKEE